MPKLTVLMQVYGSAVSAVSRTMVYDHDVSVKDPLNCPAQMESANGWIRTQGLGVLDGDYCS